MLHLLRLDEWAGTQVQVATQVIRTDPAACEQRVAILDPPGDLYERLRAAGVEVMSLNGRFGAWGATCRLALMLRRAPVDVIEAYGFRAGLIARAAAASRRPAIIIGVRGLHFSESEDADSRRTRLVIAAERCLSPTVQSYDANSRGARDFLVAHGLPRQKFTVIPNGVESETMAVSALRTGSSTRVVCVARFISRKRQDTLVRALGIVRDSGVDVEVEFIGDGPTLPRVHALVNDLGLDDRVEFAGALVHAEVQRRLLAADIFALTSLWEGMPGSVLEAMATGLPVIGSDVNGTNEAIVDGVTGLLVPPNDPGAFAHALAALASDVRLRRRMGVAGRRRIEEEFSFDRVVADKVALYRRVCGYPAVQPSGASMSPGISEGVARP